MFMVLAKSKGIASCWGLKWQNKVYFHNVDPTGLVSKINI
jgi:hypothetical protein